MLCAVLQAASDSQVTAGVNTSVNVAMSTGTTCNRTKVTGGEFVMYALAQGEARYLDEWVMYHQFIGVDIIYIYDNEGTLCTGNDRSVHTNDATGR
jgi:hypothetical protein